MIKMSSFACIKFNPEISPSLTLCLAKNSTLLSYTFQFEMVKARQDKATPKLPYLTISRRRTLQPVHKLFCSLKLRGFNMLFV